MIIENDSVKITSNFDLFYTVNGIEIYNAFNRHTFLDVTCLDIWKDCCEFICKSYNQSPDIDTITTSPKFVENKNKVVVAFSGGLDSVYQSFILREKGYDVTLLHVANMNRYTNGQEVKVAKEFAEKFNFPIEIVKFSAKPSVKEWNENPFKTSLCYCLCLDYCLTHYINMISSGDDMRLMFRDCSLNDNFGDCREVTELFFKNLPDIRYIPVDDTKNKAIRLAYLKEKGARDYYYSTVSPGRLVQKLHKLNEKKFGVKLDKWCGGSCRKDVFHCLLSYYYNNVYYPPEFIEHCWNKISIGADEVFFSKKLPLEKRIKNLIDY